MKRNFDTVIHHQWKAILHDESIVPIPLSLFEESKTLQDIRDDLFNVDNKSEIPLPFINNEWNLLLEWHSTSVRNEFMEKQTPNNLCKLLIMAHHLAIHSLLDAIATQYAKMIDSSTSASALQDQLQINIPLSKTDLYLFQQSKSK